MEPEHQHKELVAACKNGDRRAQESLYRMFSRDMYHLCLSFTGDRDQAKDLLQEAFIKIFRSLDSYQFSGTLEGWVRRVVHNTAIDYFRKSKTISYLTDELQEHHQSSKSLQELPDYINTEAVLACVKRLPEGARLVFNLFAIEGYSHKEIAAQLNISEGTSKSQYNRARGLLQDWIKKENEIT
ncbi:MAG: RNA polymerase sigma factor [Cyclobacteriaceae bacterium]|nr:RNA polymerase sigma factor [Cyclobacteriaceae bacterium]